MPQPPLKGRQQGYNDNDRVGQDRARQIAEIRSYLQTLSRVPRRVTDQNANATTNDSAVDMQRLSGPREVQLYKATAGNEIAITTSDGTASVSNTITIKPLPGCLINGAATLVLNAAYATASLLAIDSVVDGRVDWTVL